MKAVIFILTCILLIGVSTACANNGDIIFDHRNHTDIDCSECHEKALTSEKSIDLLTPSMDFCGNCHDIEDENNCGTCHREPEEPSGFTITKSEIKFSHKLHLSQKLECLKCHSKINDDIDENNLPGKPLCMKCHSGEPIPNDCTLCHTKNRNLFDIHPADWRYLHKEEAEADPDWCHTCHSTNDCIDCHRGDNIQGRIHDLNFIYTHGLEAESDEVNCVACHDNRTFCVDCHETENRMPLRHSTIGWLLEHGQSAREDIENCAACHDNADPTCARGGCHRDSDGLLGTDPPIHADDILLLDHKGPWHSDNGYYCYQCHSNSSSSGVGFCTYCHGEED